MNQEQVLDISWKTIIKVFVAGFIFYVLYLARDIALWFFFALIISVLLEPAINFLRWLRIPKIAAIILVYLSIFGFVGLLIYITAPIFVFEIKQFSQYIPEYFEKVNPLLRQFGVDVAQSFDSLTSVLISGLEQGSKGVINAVTSFFGGVASAFFILALAFFLSVEEGGVERALVFMTPQKYEERIITLFKRAQKKVSGWFGARILSCLFVGVASFIVFYIFGVKYAFLLALISGIMNFVPYIGPWITAIVIVVFVGVSSGSWLTALYVLISVAVIQAVENNILTPVLMKRMIDLPPILVLLALLIGSQLFGFLGAIFAVPVFGIVYEFLKEFLEKRKSEMAQRLD
ncbi:MAG: AI-2E family transporter [Candidatus Staskawiczbacteria bacterium]|nr:AI-2E family transporter [Candidatus Staskawiczbacteria bacterium]